jgi:hypothetical protein
VIVLVKATDPRPGAPLLAKGRWTLAVSLPGTFPRIPEGPRVRIQRTIHPPGHVRQPTAAELERIVDHVVSIDGYGEKGVSIQNRSLIRALLEQAWWIRHDVETAIGELHGLTARAG